jgi:hypothetical protein
MRGSNKARNEHSNFKIALLCIVICFAYQIIVSLLPFGYMSAIIVKLPATSPRSLASTSSNAPFTITVTAMSTFFGSPQLQDMPRSLQSTSPSMLHSEQSIDSQYKVPASTSPTIPTRDGEVCESGLPTVDI